MLRAKFRVNAVEKQGENELVTLNAVASALPNDPNHEWSKYTPSGELRMTLSNPDAQGKLEQGKSYFLDLTPAEE